jgi:hypothetical protein
MNVQPILNLKAMVVETIRATISKQNIVTNLAKHGTNLLDMPVASMMTQTVINNGILYDIVSIGDAVKYRLSELEPEAGHLRNYIAH